MTPAELAKFMSRGRRKNPEDEDPIFMRLDRIVDERAILNDLDPDLQHEVGTFLLQDVVRSNPIFAKLSSAVLTRLVVVLKPMVAEREARLVEGMNMMVRETRGPL